MNEIYFEWILGILDINKDAPQGYGLLCSILQEQLFYPILEMDENRWMDGIRYRWEFAKTQESDDRQADLVCDQLDHTLGGCTALELMLSLSERIFWEMEGSRFEAPIHKWFCELLGNLGLDIYTNAELIGNEAAYFEIDRILERLIFRKYSYNGEGGLFPLRQPDDDQREVEIATQMNNYLMENYDILEGT